MMNKSVGENVVFRDTLLFGGIEYLYVLIHVLFGGMYEKSCVAKIGWVV